MDLQILNSDDYNVEYDDLLREDSETAGQEDSYTTEDSSSPIKKQPQQPAAFNGFFPLCLGHVLLSPDTQNTNGVANELFQVTNHLHKQQIPRINQLYDVFGLNDAPDMFGGKRLNNDKVDKLVNQLRDVDDDLEMDDKQRTRVFKGRFKTDLPQPDNLDHQLNAYLDYGSSINDENKENVVPFPDPLKGVRKDQHAIRKSSKVFFKSPRRNGSKSAIPVLQPLPNLANVDLRRVYQETQLLKDQPSTIRSPKRVCLPRHTTMDPGRPSIRHSNPLLNIFVVDSLTGLINDATQFGTELNASNCEGFPLPDDVNEIVQIPTNIETRPSKKSRPKMAIIKAYHTKQFPRQKPSERVGFYSVKEFEKYKQQTSDLSVTVMLQDSSQTEGPKKVKWADELEW